MITKVENIDQFNRYFNQPTYHPLVSVANLADAHLSLFNPTDFGMYCVVLMDTEFGELILRDSDMIYQSGTIFTMKPGHVVSMNLSSGTRPISLRYRRTGSSIAKPSCPRILSIFSPSL